MAYLGFEVETHTTELSIYIYIYTRTLTYLLHGAESFLRS